MDYLSDLNPEQRKAVEITEGPLLVIAGAGSGKTRTLAYRVAHLVHCGVSPESVLLLTFTRRASEEMLRRAAGVLKESRSKGSVKGRMGRVWGGTFHGTANRLLRTYAKSVNLPPDFTVMDEGDSRNLMDMARRELGFAEKKKRFPQKGTLVSIHSRIMNTGRGAKALHETLARHYPWASDFEDDLKKLFKRYNALKHERNLFDYDDLLLFWLELLQDERAADVLEERFSHILVDESQDTNSLQGDIIRRMRRHNHNIMVVGDDAQAIYGFRAATVRNILEFPNQFPDCKTVTLSRNYRSVQPILNATNRVISCAAERYTKELWSDRKSDEKPYLVTCFDDMEQSDFVIDEVLKHREEGVALRRQAVLFRAGQLSANLEIELVRRNIPYHKYGGLRYLESAHVKDLLSFLRVLENPRDDLAWYRVLNMLPGIGQGNAGRIYGEFRDSGFSFDQLAKISVPKRSQEAYGRLSGLLSELSRNQSPLPEEVGRIREFYTSFIEDLYDNAEVRSRDLDHLENVAQGYKSRRQYLTELTLDPPSSTSDFAADPTKDEDWLVLSTMHSAKGLEFDVVYIIHAADGFIPSDLATDSEEEIEEERRLLYVAMTRARNVLYVTFPIRYYARPFGMGREHNFSQLTRFIPPEIFSCFKRISLTQELVDEELGDAGDIRKRIRNLWE